MSVWFRFLESLNIFIESCGVFVACLFAVQMPASQLQKVYKIPTEVGFNRHCPKDIKVTLLSKAMHYAM